MLYYSRSLNQITFKCAFAFWNLFCQYRANIRKESIEFCRFFFPVKYVSFFNSDFCGNSDLFILAFPIRSFIIFHVFFGSPLKLRIYSEQQFFSDFVFIVSKRFLYVLKSAPSNFSKCKLKNFDFGTKNASFGYCQAIISALVLC